MTTKATKTEPSIDEQKDVLRASGVSDDTLAKWDGSVGNDAMALPSGDGVMTIRNFIGWNDASEMQKEYGMPQTRPSDVQEFLDDNKGKAVTFLINTPGGSVFGGTEIANMIIGHDGDTTAIVTGIAASVGSLIAAACKDVQMMEASMVMIHGPQTFGYGAAADFRDLADRLDKEARAVAPIYRKRMDADEVDRMLSEGDHYLTADEAVESGFADGIYAVASGGDDGDDGDGKADDDTAKVNTDDKMEVEARAAAAKRASDQLNFLATGLLR